MADENRPNTRGRVDNRKDLDTYFKSEAFATLIKKSITEEFERFLSSEGFKDKLVSTTKSVVSEVVSGTVEAIIGNEVDKATKPLQFKIEYLEAQLAMIKSHANDNEQYSRRCNLRFHDIPEQKGENCLLVLSKFCKEELDCDIAPQDIDRAHRVGRIRSDGSSRAIIVKFVSYQSKFAVLKQRRILKLFINEDLTIANKVLFDRARKDLSHLAVWTIDGKVLVKLADDKIIRIKANKDIENLC